MQMEEKKKKSNQIELYGKFEEVKKKSNYWANYCYEQNAATNSKIDYLSRRIDSIDTDIWLAELYLKHSKEGIGFLIFLITLSIIACVSSSLKRWVIIIPIFVIAINIGIMISNFIEIKKIKQNVKILNIVKKEQLDSIKALEQKLIS